ncbi:hypothetical protein AAKU67_002228 [Oxalobacteraceae bacterium GrIS 2.11]
MRTLALLSYLGLLSFIAYDSKRLNAFIFRLGEGVLFLHIVAAFFGLYFLFWYLLSKK